MNGIILIDKPINYTSRDVVNIISKTLKIKKVGHTGTLDPLATGVLVICVGKYTKYVEMITAYDKEYEAEIILGLDTDTLDITGNILKEENIKIGKEQIIKVLNEMTKTYMQEVPIYSAVKINGKKLYEYARENKKIELPKREVNIKKLELISDIKYENNKTIFKVKCEVSKGTYIRSLIRDIAKKLNTIGTMSELKRTKQGEFLIKDCYTLKDIENNTYKFIDDNIIFDKYYTVVVDEELESKIKNGCILDNIYNQEIILFKNKYNQKLALYKKYGKDNDKIKPWKMIGCD